MVKVATYLLEVQVSSLARSLDFFPSLGSAASHLLSPHRNSKHTFRQGETKKQMPPRKLGAFPTWAITISGVLLLGGGATQVSALQRGRSCMGDSWLLLSFAPLQQGLSCLHLSFSGPLSPLTPTQKKGL